MIVDNTLEGSLAKLEALILEYQENEARKQPSNPIAEMQMRIKSEDHLIAYIDSLTDWRS